VPRQILGTPRLHLRRTDSTNARARELAARGAPHGTLVTASEQTSGRGRQGRTWSAPPGRALLCSVVLHRPPRLLPLAAGVAVAEVCDTHAAPTGDSLPAGARLKWPNDVLVDGRKVAGILVEGRPQEGWAVLGIGLNVAVSLEQLPPELHDRAATLNLEPGAIEPVLSTLLTSLGTWLAASDEAILAAVRDRDALLSQHVTWSGGSGTGAGIDGEGRLVVEMAEGRIALDAGEVHLAGDGAPG
jgi:BirA family biotin operon repressor/biotin-[acetyl-CoA-carboxylase] ligase